MALQLRRGTNAERLAMTPLIGELIYVTDYELVTLSVTAINAGTDTLTAVAHGLAVNQQIKFQDANLNGLTLNQVYFVKAVPTSDTFTLSLTLGGGIVDITGTFTIPLIFAKTPTNAAGAPLGTNSTPLWVGDGVTVGGIVAASLNLDDLLDVDITSLAEGNSFYYDATTGFWRNTNIINVNDVTNNVTLLGDLTVTGTNINTGVTDSIISIDAVVATDNLARASLTLKSTTTGTPATGMGTAINFVGQTAVSNFENAGFISVVSTDITPTDEDFSMRFGLMQAGGTYTTKMDLDSAGNLQIDGDLTVTGGDITTTSATGNLFNATATTVNIGGAATTMSIGNAAGTVTIPGNLTINGTTTNINTTNLLVEDKNITIGDVATPTDVTAAGGGITLLGLTNKTITWNNATDGWEFNQPIKVTGDIVTSGDLAVNGGDITTTQAIGNLFNTTANTVNIGDGATTQVNIGNYTSGTVNIKSQSLLQNDLGPPGVSTTFNLFNTITTDLNIGGAATAVDIGSTASGTTTIGWDAVVNKDLAVNGGDITTTEANANIFNTNATSINIGNGATTAVRIGSGSGSAVVNIKAPSLVQNPDGGASTTFNLFNTITTDLNIGGVATTVDIGSTVSGTTTIGYDLFVNNDVNADSYIVDSLSTYNTQTTTTTALTLVSISATTRASQKVVIRIIDNVSGEIHMLEALAFKKSTTAYLTTYAEMYTSAALATFTADVSAGAIRILATPASTNSTTFTVARISLD
jgi:hypothetical protein